jgi:hypothetical protein
MTENDPGDRPSPMSGADTAPPAAAAPAAPSEPVGYAEKLAPAPPPGRGTKCEPVPARRKWPVLELANIFIALGTVVAAVVSTLAVLATTDNLKDQIALDVLAGFGTTEVVQSKVALFRAAGEVDRYRTVGIDQLADLEVALAPLENQLTLTALCMGMGRCVEAGIVELFCNNARSLDDVLAAVYAQTAVVPRPTPSAAFTSALAQCPKEPS